MRDSGEIQNIFEFRTFFRKFCYHVEQWLVALVVVTSVIYQNNLKPQQAMLHDIKLSQIGK